MNQSMKVTGFIIAVLSFTFNTFAFNSIIPTFINQNKAYHVSLLEKIPEDFVALEKQRTLQLSNETYSITAVSPLPSPSSSSPSPSPSSSSSSIETLSMTAGMTFLKSDDDEQAFFINTTIDSINYPVLVDTGSPYLWLYSSNCTDKSCAANKQKLFDVPVQIEKDESFDLSYDSGSANGPIVIDDILIAGYELKDFTFGAADTVPDIFETFEFVGVLGLPLNNSIETDLVNIISFLHTDGQIEHRKFTICMGEYDSNYENDGLMLIDSEDNSSLYSGELYNLPVLDQSTDQWEFQIDKVFVNNFLVTFDAIKIDNVNSTVSRIGLLDSGTTSIILNANDALKLHSFFQNSITDGTNFAIYCNSTIDIELEISGKNWTLTPEMYIGNSYSETSAYYGYCVSNFQGLDSTGDGSWILGILFMKNNYVEFDYEAKSIGLADRNNNIKLVATNATTAAAPSTSLLSTRYALTTSVSTVSSADVSTISTSKQSNKGSRIKNADSHLISLFLIFLSVL